MKAWELLSPPGAWTKWADARDPKGKDVQANAPEAVCWCAFGALLKVYDSPGGWGEALARLTRRVGEVVRWNDGPNTGQAEVVAVLKELDL